MLVGSAAQLAEYAVQASGNGYCDSKEKANLASLRLFGCAGNAKESSKAKERSRTNQEGIPSTSRSSMEKFP